MTSSALIRLAVALVLVGCGSAGSASNEGAAGQSTGGDAGTAGTAGAGGSAAGKAGASTGGAGAAGAAGKGGAGGSGGGSGGNGAAGATAGAGGTTAGSGGTAGASSASGAGAGGASGTAGAGGEKTCPPPPTCNAAPPNPGSKESWNHITSNAIVLSGSATHRGRDLFINPGAPQWIIGKFAYGIIDKDLKDENVDIYVLRNCQGPWEKLGTSKTTYDGDHATVEGVADTGGRVYFQVPSANALGLGRHRVHMVVKGDLTTTDLFLEVVPAKTPFFLSDVDGTLTTSENEEFTALLTGSLPNMNPDASAAQSLLAKKGYRPMYVTARPEFLVGRTREFLDTNGFPPGIVQTSTTLTGELGAAATAYKTTALKLLSDKGLVPAWVFGNTATDADAYDNGKIMPLDHRIFFQFTDTAHGGRRIESYTELLSQFGSLPAVCP